MSQKQATKSQFITVLLWATVLFLGYTTFFGQKPPPETRTPDQIMQSLEKQAGDLKTEAAKQSRTVQSLITDIKAKDQHYDLFFPHPQLSGAQDLKHLYLLNDLIADFSSAPVEREYENRINEIKGMSDAEKNDLEVKSQALLTDTQYKAAAQAKDIQKASFASDGAIRLDRYNSNKPVWNEAVAVAPHPPEFPESQVTPHDLKAQVDSLSQDLGKNIPVWGFFPGYQMVDGLVHLLGANPSFSYALAALILAICVRAVVYPFSQKQMMWSRQMSQLGPLVNEIKEEYKKKDQTPANNQEMQKRIMELYSEYGINPFSGCLPAFLQLPLFWLIYNSMLHYRFDFQKGLFLWINPSTSAATHGFIARNLGEKDYILIVIYGISMVITTLLAPITDPSNARQQRLMGLSFSILFGIMMFFWPVPSAFVLYWVFTNILATAQSLRAYRLPMQPLVKKNAPNGGVFPTAVGTNGKLNGKPKSTGAPQTFEPKKKQRKKK